MILPAGQACPFGAGELKGPEAAFSGAAVENGFCGNLVPRRPITPMVRGAGVAQLQLIDHSNVNEWLLLYSGRPSTYSVSRSVIVLPLRTA